MGGSIKILQFHIGTDPKKGKYTLMIEQVDGLKPKFGSIKTFSPATIKDNVVLNDIGSEKAIKL